MPIAEPSKKVEKQLAARRDAIRVAYADDERTAAQDERREREERDRASSVYSVRLPPDVYESVRRLAEQLHSTPSALIRQWVSERVGASAGETDLEAVIASLRVDVERLARLAKPA